MILLLALGGLWFYGESKWQSDLDNLRAGGLPTRASEVNDFYVVPQDVPDTTRQWVDAIDAVRAANLPTRGSTLPYLGTGTMPIPGPGESWAQLEAARNLLVELGPEMQALRRAATAGGQARFPVDFSAGLATALTHTQASRDVARLLALDAWVSAHDGKPAQVLEDLRGIFALSDALRGEPVLISQLVRIAIFAVGCDAAARLMPHMRWTDAEWKSLQAAVQAARFKDEMERALCGERGLCLSGLDDMPLGPLRQTNAREALRLFAIPLDSFAGTWPEILARQREMSTELQAGAESGLINRTMLTPIRLILPALEQACRAGARGEARQRCLVAAIAIERFRLQRGRVPETLAEVADLIGAGAGGEVERLIDPYDGLPLRYKVEQKRLLIYSTGENAQDDGGDVDRDDHQASGRLLDLGYSIKQ